MRNNPMKSLGVLTGAAGLAAYLNADVVAKYAERVTDALQQRAAESLMKMLQMEEEERTYVNRVYV